MIVIYTSRSLKVWYFAAYNWIIFGFFKSGFKRRYYLKAMVWLKKKNPKYLAFKKSSHNFLLEPTGTADGVSHFSTY